MDKEPQIFVVIGPTASGKSDFAVELAKKHNGEVISTDSRQIYKGLDIGTGKITKEEMKGVPHHMLSVYNLDEKINVTRYVADAKKILEDIIARGKTPVICGGTGQYTLALITSSTFPEVPPNAELRKKLEQKTTKDLYLLLVEKDARRAESIDKHNPVRLIRALEIIDALGVVPLQEEASYIYPTEIYTLTISRVLLRKRVTTRLDKRLAEGMIDEVQDLLDQGYTEHDMKRFGLEYDLISAYLKDKMSIDEMKEKLITAIIHYAKRQETWNKKHFKDTIKITVGE